MLVYSNIHKESTAQVKGAAKIMVTVVATQELEAGDVLQRFKAEAAQDEPRRGNNNTQYSSRSSSGLGNCRCTSDYFHLCSFFLFVGIRVCVFFCFFVGTRV